VQGENASSARARVIELREQLGQGERASILIEAEMRVGVKDLCIGRAQTLHLRQERSEGVGI
jgi:hypothetical protein